MDKEAWLITAMPLEDDEGDDLRGRTLRLHDDSRMVLKPNATVELIGGGSKRGCTLLKGKIFVRAMASDQPFEVHAGPVTVHALDACFGVALDRENQNVAIEVGEGTLEVIACSDAAQIKRVTMSRGQSGAFGVNEHCIRVRPTTLTQSTTSLLHAEDPLQ